MNESEAPSRAAETLAESESQASANPPAGKGRSLVRVAGIVAVATLGSKVAGLLRQVAIAAAFGVGPAVDAYNYAYVIPGFLLVLLGGINGPFHSAVVSVLSRRSPKESARVLETVTAVTAVILALVTLAIIGLAAPMMKYLVAPGLDRSEAGREILAIAIGQLRIMAPMALLSGLIGIGFGTLNATDRYWLPSLSPIFSSLAVLAGIGWLLLRLGDRITDPQYAVLGGLVLAWGTLGGAVLQWLVQLPPLWQQGLGRFRLRFDWHDPAVREMGRIALPATLSSGLLHLNVYTDLFFASFIPQAAAALGYAQLLVQTPLGLLSNVILVPLMPLFARLTAPAQRAELIDRIRQGMMMTAIAMLPLSTLTVALAMPVVRLVYERYAFDLSASAIVASVLAAYGVGMFVYLGRDVLVRVFYALGDGETPFRVSALGVALNVVLDYLCIQPFGAAGLALATAGVNAISLVVLLVLLDRRLGGLPWRAWGLPLLHLTLAAGVAGGAAWGAQQGLAVWVGDRGTLSQLLQVAIAGGLGLGSYTAIISRLGLPEVKSLRSRLHRRSSP